MTLHTSRSHEYYEDDRIIYIVLEFVDGGNLLDYIMEVPGESGLCASYPFSLRPFRGVWV
jgi:serine/threonine protein kinase